jgi:hypothetical protein
MRIGMPISAMLPQKQNQKMSDDKGDNNNKTNKRSFDDSIDIDKRMRLVRALDDLGFHIIGGHYSDFTVVFGWEDMQVHISGDDYEFGIIDDEQLFQDVIEVLDRARDNNARDDNEERAQRDKVKKRIQLADSEDESAFVRGGLQYFAAGINSSSEEGLDEEEMDDADDEPQRLLCILEAEGFDKEEVEFMSDEQPKCLRCIMEEEGLDKKEVKITFYKGTQKEIVGNLSHGEYILAGDIEEDVEALYHGLMHHNCHEHDSDKKPAARKSILEESAGVEEEDDTSDDDSDKKPAARSNNIPEASAAVEEEHGTIVRYEEKEAIFFQSKGEMDMVCNIFEDEYILAGPNPHCLEVMDKKIKALESDLTDSDDGDQSNNDDDNDDKPDDSNDGKKTGAK